MSKIEEALKKSRLSNKRDMTNYQGNKHIPSLGSLALMSSGTSKSNEELSKLKIIYPAMDEQNILNEFRSIRAALTRQLKGKNASIMIFSTEPGGGASYFSANIAASIALDPEKTALLISCDFKYKPQYEQLIAEEKYGLIDYLSGEVDIEQIIHPAGFERLRIIPSSNTGSMFSEYFSTSKFVHLIEEITTRYRDRFIIIDAPSAKEEANVKLLEEFADFVILVVPSGKNSANQINKAKNLISKDKFLGVVINNIPRIIK